MHAHNRQGPIDWVTATYPIHSYIKVLQSCFTGYSPTATLHNAISSLVFCYTPTAQYIHAFLYHVQSHGYIIDNICPYGCETIKSHLSPRLVLCPQ